jgi:hypothetical protein
LCFISGNTALPAPSAGRPFDDAEIHDRGHDCAARRDKSAVFGAL